MKKMIIAALLVSALHTVYAQDEKEESTSHGFKKENLFTGGSIMASFYTGGTALGISPYFGYSINKFIDVAASFNVNYNSERDYYNYGDKLRQTTYGPGAFVRLYPVRFLFAQGSYEHNFIKLKYIPASNSSYLLTTTKQDANSALIGGGFCNGRQGTGDIFYYFSVMWDVSRVAESPYVDGLGRNYPIFRAGLQIPLFQGGDSHRYGKRRW
ncbi:MAG: hypothetical protein JST86_04225 [Bacteroidetes bacterium]|nr:hypothetical protein [Bacteroidota bacterium]